jgi:phosphoserine phosphatase
MLKDSTAPEQGGLVGSARSSPPQGVRTTPAPLDEATSVLDELRTHEGMALVDLDETLYLRNSTEDFLDSARPSLIAAVALRLLDALSPWAMTGGEPTRDVWRVALVMLLAPWTPIVWRRRVRQRALDLVNRPLLDAIRERVGPTAIVSVGFRFVVEPLARAFGLESIRIVACRLSFSDRRKGKLALAVGALGETEVARSMVVTDSEADRPLLDRCAHARLIVWAEARYVRAFSSVYLPGQYITWVKRPGERYILRGVLQEDFAFWVLASISLAHAPFVHVGGLLLLLVSFWALYERGYVDNDLVAARFEADPKLSAAFHSHAVATPRVQPWIWALIFGAAGVAVLDLPHRPTPVHLAAWSAVLIATSVWFRLYNRSNKALRVWMYLPLQLARCVGFAAVVPVTAVGALALGAHALSRWFHYYAYRLGKGSWPKVRTELIRLMSFLVLAGLVALAQGPAVVITWTALAIVLWSLFRARWEIRELLTSAGRLHGPTSRR